MSKTRNRVIFSLPTPPTSSDPLKTTCVVTIHTRNNNKFIKKEMNKTFKILLQQTCLLAKCILFSLSLLPQRVLSIRSLTIHKNEDTPAILCSETVQCVCVGGGVVHCLESCQEIVTKGMLSC